MDVPCYTVGDARTCLACKARKVSCIPAEGVANLQAVERIAASFEEMRKDVRLMRKALETWLDVQIEEESAEGSD